MKYFIDCKDKRNKYLMEQMKNENFDVCDVNSVSMKEKGCFVYAPNKKFGFEEINTIPDGSVLFCGNVDSSIQNFLIQKNIKHINFLSYENFAVKNANLTAEGVLNLLLTVNDKSLFENKILILGNGRVAKSCAILLGKLGADFALCSFRDTSFASNFFYSNNCIKGVELNTKIQNFDIIINTIPAKIIDENLKNLIKKEAVVIETASINCLDKNQRDIFQYILAPGLPQKVTAFSAGKLMFEIIKQNI